MFGRKPQDNVRDLVAGSEPPALLTVLVVDADKVLAVAFERVTWLVVRQVSFMTQDPANLLYVSLNRWRQSERTGFPHEGAGAKND